MPTNRSHNTASPLRNSSISTSDKKGELGELDCKLFSFFELFFAVIQKIYYFSNLSINYE